MTRISVHAAPRTIFAVLLCCMAGASCAGHLDSKATGAEGSLVASSSSVSPVIEGAQVTVAAVDTPIEIGTEISLVPAPEVPALSDPSGKVAEMTSRDSRIDAWLKQAKEVVLRYGVLRSSIGSYDGAAGYYLRLADGPTCVPNGAVETSALAPMNTTSDAAPSAANSLPPMTTEPVPCTVGIFLASDGSGVDFTLEGAF